MPDLGMVFFRSSCLPHVSWRDTPYTFYRLPNLAGFEGRLTWGPHRRSIASHDEKTMRHRNPGVAGFPEPPRYF